MKQAGLTRKDFEIMAPVGSWESLHAAIQGGADAVYFGIEGLNMRARSAKTFDTEDMRQMVKICDEKGIKSYLTVNTIIYDGDMNLLHQIIDSAKEAGVSAIIASDIAAMSYAYDKGVEVHLSVQLNITNVEALRFYARFADVVVLARELNLDQVDEIHRAILEQDIRGPRGELIRIEMFSHGALCMAVSGKCYLSLHEMNSSANRGACNQICRRGYTVKDNSSDMELEIENEYIMSPKDLKTIHFMNKMMDAGVRVFKIEGRARGPEYVRTVCACYNEAIIAHLENSYTDEKIADWDERLAKVFNRGFWDGYYLGQRLGEWTHKYGSSATQVKTHVGKVIKYFSNIGVAEFELEGGYIDDGEELLVAGPTTGAVFFSAEDMRVDDESHQRIDEKGLRFSAKVPEKVRPGDALYVMRNVKDNNKSKFQ
ncbi:MAG: U32 family peptidase [Bacteroidales bacterium]|uniref:peptidase U32 family protein n=1 Tax=Porphyromonas sp. TaxID=1924944 RepID=UPI0029733E93|nr:peptidase U32 family protein [Porphyromonas sp.]MDD7437944.1 U32 family peptidase [Bacteroidales bacterium]MDY3067371.1 peptidase U32 family protein [Porphyromonas sp.]